MQVLLVRILAKVRIDPVTGCWNWTGELSQSGWRCVFYPEMKVHGRVWRVNRLVLMLYTGLAEVPIEGRDARTYLEALRRHFHGVESAHECDNARCINPQHLRWKGHRANIQEQVERRKAMA